ncbi:SPOR domain-containing protein [Acidimangrovimonas sediminis]|uniref:SPOR domain-containing protein n=2 Tax=Albidovulum sediminis TaxID=3066345 RepID=A0ABT2NL12_9RHOB|nr:SPOR domain-containing protein [Defluviimonas sediminis]
MAVLLSGCVGGTSPFGGGGDEPTTVQAPARPGKTEEREAPEAFSLTDTALWDGRPSLGGIWVAHGSVTTPERVIIRNTENGKSVKGALFRREREFPGPSIQMSSDAAAALGALAGQPVKVSVIALRMEEVAPPPAAPEDGDAIETKAIDPVAATAAAAIAKAEADARPVARPRKPAAAAPAPAKAAPAAAPAAAAAPAPAPEPAPAKPAAATPVPETAAEPAAPAAEGAPLSGVLKQPYVQIGTFSSEENAKRAALDLSKAGMSAVVRKSGEGSVWRVIVGPALSAAERDALLERVKSAGYPDAFAVGG